MNIFEQLNSINVNDKTEKKNGLTYLSWAWAWAEFKKKFPDSFYTIYENKEGWNYFTDGKTCWVKTGVTLVKNEENYDALELIEYLPIMDFKNKSIPLGQVTSFDVNKAIQRSLTKAVARHGLGLYVYAGEDLPEKTDEDKAREANEAKRLKEICTELDTLLTNLVGKADADTKKTFFNDNVIPIIGVMNYRKCTDLENMEQLLTKIKAIKAA